MTQDADVTVVSDMIERAFNRGDLSAVDDLLLPASTDHQEAPGVNFPQHLKQVVTMLRTAFPDLHFEIKHLMSSGDIVAMHSVMTGTHLGPMRDLPRPSAACTCGTCISCASSTGAARSCGTCGIPPP